MFMSREPWVNTWMNIEYGTHCPIISHVKNQKGDVGIRRAYVSAEWTTFFKIEVDLSQKSFWKLIDLRMASE